MNNNFKILTSKEEKQLSSEQLKQYYKDLRTFLLNTKPQYLTKGSLTICPKINPYVKKLLNKFCGYEIIIQGIEKTYDNNNSPITAIYAHTHQSINDHINFIVANPEHTILLNSSVLSMFYKLVLSINGVTFVNKQDNESRNNAKIEMIRLLLQGKSVTIFPESAWNCSPNKLLLPMRTGIIDIAKKAGVPVIPVLQEYIYDETRLNGKEKVLKVYIKFGEPIYVKEEDDLIEKLEEYKESISTMRWELIEKKGIYKREEISNEIYINFLKGCVRNLKQAKIDIEVEKQGIYGASDDFYLFHHINAVDYDENNNLLPTKHVRKLIKLYDDNNKL